MDKQTFDYKRRLLELNQRKLNVVKEQIAHFGKQHAPAYKIIEMEDLQQEIDDLKYQLLGENPEEVTFDKLLDTIEKTEQLEDEIKRVLDIYMDVSFLGK
jgi:pyridoxine 5'-phosphate synthase PdxJ